MAAANGDALSPNCGTKDRKLLLCVVKVARMNPFRIAAAALAVFCSAALAQSPGVGETRPSAPQDSTAPDTASKSSEPRRDDGATTRERASQCPQLSGKPRDECLRAEREPAAGGTQPPREPPTAPPPQNPR